MLAILSDSSRFIQEGADEWPAERLAGAHASAGERRSPAAQRLTYRAAPSTRTSEISHPPAAPGSAYSVREPS